MLCAYPNFITCFNNPQKDAQTCFQHVRTQWCFLRIFSKLPTFRHLFAHMLHVLNIYSKFARTKSPSFVGKYTSTMEHMDWGYQLMARMFIPRVTCKKAAKARSPEAIALRHPPARNHGCRGSSFPWKKDQLRCLVEFRTRHGNLGLLNRRLIKLGEWKESSTIWLFNITMENHHV